MRSLLPLMISNLFCIAIMMSLVAIIGPLVRSLEMSEWQGGIIFSVGGLCWMIFSRRWGQLSDRLGRKGSLMIALVGLTVSCFLFALVLKFALEYTISIVVVFILLVLTRGLVGLFYAGIPISINAFIADNYPPAERAGKLGLMSAAAALGMIIGPLFTGVLVDEKVDLSWPLFVIIIFPVLALILVYFVLPKPIHRDNKQRAILSLLDKRLRFPLICAFCAVFCVLFAQVLVGFFVMDRINVPLEEVSKVASYTMVVVGLMMMFAGILLNIIHLHPKLWIALGSAMGSVGFVCVGLIDTVPMLLVCYLFSSLGVSILFPSMFALAANSVQPHEQGLMAGSVATIQGLASVLGPILATLLYKIEPSIPYFCCGAVLMGVLVMSLYSLYSQRKNAVIINDIGIER